MALLRVESHREGVVGDVRISVHGQEPDENGLVESQGSPSWVQFQFSGKPGARLRVQIRHHELGGILYREEVQLPEKAGSFDSGERYFSVDETGLPAQSSTLHTLAMVEATAASVELEIKVSNRQGINGYGFAFDGVPVPMSDGKGEFRAVKGEARRLEWVMRGNPGSTMKVEVLRDGAALYTREKSTIVPPFGTGLDAFQILIP